MADREAPSVYKLWLRHDGMTEDGGQAPSEYTLEQIENEVKGHTVTEMAIEGDVPDWLNRIAPNLVSLSITGVKDASSLKFVFQLYQLETLKLDGNDLSADGVLDGLKSFQSLKKLSLSKCELRRLPSSIQDLHVLEVLDLSNNCFSADGVLDGLGSLKSLKELHLSKCQLRDLPENISNLTDLKTLNLAQNNFAEGLPAVIGTVPFLENLDISCCNFTAHSSFPDRFRSDETLEQLNLQDNDLVILAECIHKLTSLKTLNLSNNKHLKSLGEGIRNLTKLTKIEVDNCGALSFPPLERCKAGLGGTESFFSSIESPIGCQSKVLLKTMAVIGRSGSGKTSLIRTLQNSKERKRKLTERDAKNDEATKVFNVQTVEIENREMRFIDFGGQEIYHSSYHLTYRENCVPVVVVNMEEYDRMVNGKTKLPPKEAVRQLFFDWMSHLYLVQPDLDPPKLIFTHKDCFDDESFSALEKSFFKSASDVVDDIREELKNPERLVGFQRIRQFANQNEQFFAEEDIHRIGKGKDNEEYPYFEFDNIRYSLFLKCLHHLVNPDKSKQDIVESAISKWYIVDRAIFKPDSPSEQAPYYVLKHILNQIEPAIKEDELQNVLSLMHNCGILLWYKDRGELAKDREEVDKYRGELAKHIFPDTRLVTQLVEVFYDHNDHCDHNENAKWTKRRKNVEERYQKDVDQFLDTGVMSKGLIFRLIEMESVFKKNDEQRVAFALLYTFRLIFGPIDKEGQEHFIIPSYHHHCKDAVTLQHSDKPLHFHLTTSFQGLALPEYVYHQSTVDILNWLRDDDPDPVVRIDGVEVSLKNGSIMYQMHDHKKRELSVELLTGVENIASSWDRFVSITCKTIGKLRETWIAAAHTCRFKCLHCLLKGDEHPETESKKLPWCQLDNREYRIPERTESRPVVCNGDLDVPAILKRPCKRLTNREQKSLNAYVARKLAEKEKKAELGHLTEDEEELDGGDVSEESDVEDAGIQAIHAKEITLDFGQLRSTRLPQIRRRFRETTKAYKMSTPKRGRAFIINNTKFDGYPSWERHGSEVDVKNMSGLLNKLRFELTVKTDLSAEQMLAAIREETRHPHHIDYDMCVLVIMTHGFSSNGDGEALYGSDMKAVKLQTIYKILSDDNLPGLGRKPKFIIVQSCGTDLSSKPTEEDIMRDKEMMERKGRIGPLIKDEMIVAKSSCGSYPSMRDPKLGSPFIRCLVQTFLKHSCHRDVWKLLQMVQRRVMKGSLKLAADGKDHVFPQLPAIYSSLTQERDLYLYPRYSGEVKPKP